MKREGLRPSCTKSHERSACSRLSVMRNQASGTSSVWYEAMRKESFSSSGQYKESSKLEFVRTDNVTRWRACPCPSGTRNQAGETTSVCYKVARKEGFYSSVRYEYSSKQDYVCHEVQRKDGLTSSIRYEESSRQDFVHSVRSRTNGGYVLVRPVRGIKLAGLCPFGTKSRVRRA